MAAVVALLILQRLVAVVMVLLFCIGQKDIDTTDY
jgi:hypothetical protein